MNIVVCYKWVLDEADIQVSPDGALDTARAASKISDYDRNALQAALQLAGPADQVIALTYGTPAVQKSLKDVLSRGPAQACWVGDDTARTADGGATAKVLAAALRKIGGTHLVVCAEGASDTYAHEIGPRLGALLDLPVVSNALELAITGNTLRATRLLGESLQIVEVDLPAVVTVLPAAAAAPIPGLKAVLAASKKPTVQLTLAELGLSAGDLAPQTDLLRLEGFVMSRKNQVIGPDEPAVQVRKLLAALAQEGVLP